MNTEECRCGRRT